MQPTTRPIESAAGVRAVAEGVAAAGFWRTAWRRFRGQWPPLLALGFVAVLTVVGLLAPAIAGTRPIVASYKGSVYFPFMGSYRSTWENGVFRRDRFRDRYPVNLARKDPQSWAVWPLWYASPYRTIDRDEFPGVSDLHGDPAPLGQPPTLAHPFGTDPNGRDVLARLVHGTLTALLVGFVSMGIASAIGITLGAVAGYFGGWTDTLVSRFIELVMCLPALVLILALIAIVANPTIWTTMVVLGVTGWTGIARLTRAEFLRLRETEFVSAIRALGAGDVRIMFRHILPNALAPVLVPITFGIAAAILVESALSFLGLGPANTPSWGKLLNEGRQNYQMWWLILFPGMAIFGAVLSYNLIGEGVQEATDPRLLQSRQ